MNVTAGNIVEETNYDAWGRVRNPTDWTYTNAQPLTTIFRGYTGHEMLPEFSLINMNGRMYDPLIGRMLSPDNKVADLNNPQAYNKYAYAMNNPLKYVDPNGEVPFLIWAAVAYFTFFTDFGYEAQKNNSPVALKINASFGTHRQFLGYELSVGVPRNWCGVSARYNYGNTYYWKSYGNDFKGWVTRKGFEVSFVGDKGGLFTYEFTRFKEDNPQDIGQFSFGKGKTRITASNDLFSGSGGDEYRTNLEKINYGLFSIGNTNYTGDAIGKEKINGKWNYIEEEGKRYRHGILSFGFGPIEIGWDSEVIRAATQNAVHDLLPKTHRFRNLGKYPKEGDNYDGGSLYFQFGSSGLW